MKKSILGVMMLCTFLFISIGCDKDCESCDSDAIVGTLETQADLAGCVLLLTVLTDDYVEIYEPVIMPDLDFEIENGMEVCVKFEEYPSASICMMGTTIEITSCEVYVPCE